jgi:hypothetical protein
MQAKFQTTSLTTLLTRKAVMVGLQHQFLMNFNQCGQKSERDNIFRLNNQKLCNKNKPFVHLP